MSAEYCLFLCFLVSSVLGCHFFVYMFICLLVFVIVRFMSPNRRLEELLEFIVITL